DICRQKGIPMTGELEFASSLIKEPIIAVTGTNGKSTVTKLIYDFLVESGVPAWIGGNYGPPLIDFVSSKQKASVLVVEVSSFQLETIDQFKPHHAVLLNIAPDHLDRYRNIQEYSDAKKAIFKNATKECVGILNADDPLVVECARDPRVQQAQLQYF